MSTVRLRYQTIEFGDRDIHVRSLRDKQQFSDDEQVAEKLGISSAIWPLFGVVWESGEILARLMHLRDTAGLRVLELGCGIGLASLVLKQQGADITATDYHPEANAFLDANAALNGLSAVPFVRVAWDDESSELGIFDLIIASDVLYEQFNLSILTAFIDQHGAPDGEILIVDPGRGLSGKFTSLMVKLGYRHDSSLKIEEAISTTFKGRVHRFSRGLIDES